jgi:hypothetical protein
VYRKLLRMRIPRSDIKTETDVTTGPGPDRGSVRAPRWVRVFGALAALFFAVFVVLHLLGGGLSHHRLPGAGRPRASPADSEMHHDDGPRRVAAQP